VRGHDHQLPDYSPDGVSERIELSRHTLVDLASTSVDDEDDRRCAALLRDRLTVEIDSFEAGEHLRPLRLIGSPVSGLRSVFDLTPRQTESDWLAIAQRIEAVPLAYEQLVRSLRVGKQRRLFAAPRQAIACAEQADTWAGANGSPWFASYVRDAPAALRKRLDAAAGRASSASPTWPTSFVTNTHRRRPPSPMRWDPSGMPLRFASIRAPRSMSTKPTRGHGRAGTHRSRHGATPIRSFRVADR
jgi:uncharacterized protein (DUF885 family)